MPDQPPRIVIAKPPPRSPRRPRKSSTTPVRGLVGPSQAQAETEAAEQSARGDLADALFQKMKDIAEREK